jgi:hypothetical protein
MMNGQVTQTKFTISETLIIKGGQNNSGSITLNMAVIANQTNDVTSYTNLYDKYKICAYKVTFIPRATQFELYNNQTDGNDNFILWTCLDYDDAAAPTSTQYVMNYRNKKWTRGTQVHKRYVKHPHILGAIANNTTGASTVNSANIRAPWIDAASLSIPHYGVKWACLPGGAATNLTYIDVILDVYVKWAGRR